MSSFWYKAVMLAVLSSAMLTAQASTNELYNSACATCHAAGVLGAPKTGDKAAWAPRLKKGLPTLVNNTKNGYKNMPARGLCDSCTDADYTALVELMSK